MKKLIFTVLKTRTYRACAESCPTQGPEAEWCVPDPSLPVPVFLRSLPVLLHQTTPRACIEPCSVMPPVKIANELHVPVPVLPKGTGHYFTKIPHHTYFADSHHTRKKCKKSSKNCDFTVAAKRVQNLATEKVSVPSYFSKDFKKFRRWNF